MKEELQNMRGLNIFGCFYETLKSTREYHHRFQHIDISHGSELEEIVVPVQFSGEEVFGKYLDLHAFYLRYCNLQNLDSRDQDYLQYLEKFNSFFYIPEKCKNMKSYTVYVNDLWNYLSDFFRRTQPLIDLNETIAEWKNTFDEKWNNGTISGWKSKQKNSGISAAPQPLRLGMFNAIEELEALGPDRLKQALEALNLKCGGTLHDRAERLWLVRGKKPEDIPAKLKQKKIENSKDSSNSDGDNASKQVLFKRFLYDLLSPTNYLRGKNNFHTL